MLNELLEKRKKIVDEINSLSKQKELIEQAMLKRKEEFLLISGKIDLYNELLEKKLIKKQEE